MGVNECMVSDCKSDPLVVLSSSFFFVFVFFGANIYRKSNAESALKITEFTHLPHSFPGSFILSKKWKTLETSCMLACYDRQKTTSIFSVFT